MGEKRRRVALKTWKLQNGRGKEVNDVLKDFDELERTGLGLGNAIVARRYPVKYEGKEEEGGRDKRAKDGGDIEMEDGGGDWGGGGGGNRRNGKREASFDGPRVPWAPAGSDADRKSEIEEKRRSETKAIRRESSRAWRREG